MTLFGQLTGFIGEVLDSSFESLGWLLMYLSCALSLVEKREKATPNTQRRIDFKAVSRKAPGELPAGFFLSSL